jgi:hypothetical protein
MVPAGCRLRQDEAGRIRLTGQRKEDHMATGDDWKEVGERFTNLGKQLKTSYERHGDDRDEAGGRRAIEDALQSLADALGQVVSSAGKAVRDPAVGDEAKAAARSLAGALSTSFEQVNDKLRDRFRKSGEDADEEAAKASESASSPPSGDDLGPEGQGPAGPA